MSSFIVVDDHRKCIVYFIVDHSQTLDALEAYSQQKFKGQPPLKLNVYMKVECGYG